MFVEFNRAPYRTLGGSVLYMWRELLASTIIVSIVYVCYEFLGIKSVALHNAIPLGVVGTALSIFLGFRNNSAYDRWWEGRKIWGGIVNISRTFGAQMMTYVTDAHTQKDSSTDPVEKVHKEMIYRHIAYINALRLHLRKQFDAYEEVLAPYLPEDELKELLKKKNKPTQINFNQAQRLKSILKDNLIEDFRLYEMMKSIEVLYELQGKCERIKNTPFPLYYSMFTRLMLFIFILFLPLSLIHAFGALGVTWLVIPICVATTFVLSVIERTSRTTENPFENFYGDVPMSGLCRTIEIDLREMLGETELPESLAPEEPRPGMFVLR